MSDLDEIQEALMGAIMVSIGRLAKDYPEQAAQRAAAIRDLAAACAEEVRARTAALEAAIATAIGRLCATPRPSDPEYRASLALAQDYVRRVVGDVPIVAVGPEGTAGHIA